MESFEDVDSNYNRHISIAEWRRALHAHGFVDDALVRRTYRQLDRDGRDGISKAEFEEGLRKAKDLAKRVRPGACCPPHVRVGC